VFGREVRYSNAQGRIAFVDSGPKISVLDQSDTSVLAALQLAREKYGKDLVVSGSEEFQSTVLRLAVRNNIALANPELQERIQREKDRVAADRSSTKKGQGFLSSLGGISSGGTRRNKEREEKSWNFDHPERCRRV